MHLFGAALIEEVHSLPQLGAPDDGVVHKQQILSLDQFLNRDLLLTAAMFHDIGKTRELSRFPQNDYTDEGQLIGHIIIGVEMIDEKIKEIPDFPPVLSAELRHCILAHHGELEYGSPKKPALAEAAALNFADNTDAKLEIFKEMLEKGTEENSWLGWQQLLDSNIRKTEL